MYRNLTANKLLLMLCELFCPNFIFLQMENSRAWKFFIKQKNSHPHKLQVSKVINVCLHRWMLLIFCCACIEAVLLHVMVAAFVIIRAEQWSSQAVITQHDYMNFTTLALTLLISQCQKLVCVSVSVCVRGGGERERETYCILGVSVKLQQYDK